MYDESFDNDFEGWKIWNKEETDLDTLHCNLVWEFITNP